MTFETEKVARRRWRGLTFGCSEANHTESDKKKADQLNQQVIFIPQWPELVIIDQWIFYNNVIAIYPSRASLAKKMF